MKPSPNCAKIGSLIWDSRITLNFYQQIAQIEKINLTNLRNL